VKIGFKITRKGRKQRWLCKYCGRTFYATEAPEATPTARSSLHGHLPKVREMCGLTWLAVLYGRVPEVREM
jgi:transposase-like protein